MTQETTSQQLNLSPEMKTRADALTMLYAGFNKANKAGAYDLNDAASLKNDLDATVNLLKVCVRAETDKTPVTLNSDSDATNLLGALGRFNGGLNIGNKAGAYTLDEIVGLNSALELLKTFVTQVCDKQKKKKVVTYQPDE